MSHFAVLVVGPNVEEQLAPYHEFECTGLDDQYVQDVDITAQARGEYEKQTKSMNRGPDGSMVPRFDDQFYREPTEEETKDIGPIAGSGSGHGISWHSKDWGDGRGYRTKVRFVPEGWTEVEVPRSDAQSFAEFVEDWYGITPVKLVITDKIPIGEWPLDKEKDHKYGYTLLDKDGEVHQVIDRTNPNKTWDWWVLGGRYTGWFKAKDRSMSHALAITGEPGLMTKPANAGYVDQAIKSDIDIDGMRDEAAEKAMKYYRGYVSIIAGLPAIVPWVTIREKHDADIKAARDEYNKQPAVVALRNDREYTWAEPEALACTEAEYVQRARDKAMVTFAVVKDGQWYERGSMGWWGCVSDKKDMDEWIKQFNSLIDDLPDDTILSVVDCHI